MKALRWMDRYWKEELQVSTWKHGINVQYLYDIVGKVKASKNKIQGFSTEITPWDTKISATLFEILEWVNGKLFWGWIALSLRNFLFHDEALKDNISV